MKLPNTAEELITLLDQAIPEPAPRPGTSHDQVMFDAGRRSVVLWLKELRSGSIPQPLREHRGAGRVRR